MCVIMYKHVHESAKKKHLRLLNNARCNRYYHRHKNNAKQQSEKVIENEVKKDEQHPFLL